MRLTRHAKILSLASFIVALRAWNCFVLLVLEALPSYMILAVTGLASETRILPKLITRLAFIRLTFENLARALVLKLVIFTKEIITERAFKHSPSMIPNTSFALNANCVR